MPGLYSPYKTYSSGEILTAADLNATDTNHITNQTLEMTDDYSADAATYHLSTVPSHATLPTSAAEEVRHMRGAVKGITGKSNWDDAPDITIASLFAISNAVLTQGFSPRISMVWKDVATITIQAGNYYCGNSLLNLASNTDWSWTLDTGSEASSTWYYMYLANVSGTPTAVASTTAPTARINTGLSGTTYDANIYLGAFYNNGSLNIPEFYQNKNKTMFLYQGVLEIMTTNSNVYDDQVLNLPSSAQFGIIIFALNNDQSTTCSGYFSIDGTNHLSFIESTSIGQHQEVFMTVPFKTAKTVYIKNSTNAGDDDVIVAPIGWIDKWL